MRRIFIAGVFALAVAPCFATGMARKAIEGLLSAPPASVPETGHIDVAFSPRGGAQDLVIRVIDSATSSIHMLAYTYTSYTINKALLRARRRGVEVYLVVDYENNFENDRTGLPQVTLNALVRAGAHVRTIAAYKMQHDKSIVVDGAHVQQGSFNFTSSAEQANSENVLVHWNNPALAAIFLQHFERNWSLGKDYRPAS